MKQRVIVLAVALLILAPAFGQKVTRDWDRSANFEQYQTYAWAEGTDIPNPLMHQRVIAAIDYQLSMKGLLKQDSNPDMYVAYHANSSEQVILDTTSWGYGYGSGWRGRGGYGGGSSTTTMRTYNKGTLVIDMWSTKAKQILWRGTITNTIADKPEKNEKRINKGTEKLFKKFPPK